MAKFDIEKFIEELKGAGYFKTDESSNRGNIKRYNGLTGGFQELNNSQFIKLLVKIIGTANAYDYWSYIKTELPVFPTKQYIKYENYLKLRKEKRLEPVERDFLRRFYEPNNKSKKPVGELTSNRDDLKDIQTLINNDIFTDGKDLYKYDLDEKTFILVTKDNIGTLINCEDSEIANKCLETGLKKNYELVNIYESINVFNKARDTETRLKMYKKDYIYINELKESINIKFENTFSIMF